MPKKQVLKAKVCLVGEGAVGKTCLIRRFVVDQFADDYIETLGAKVSKKHVEVPLPAGDLVTLEMTIWDVMGQRTFRELLLEEYFEGTSGILAVSDVTRRETLEALPEWIDRVDRIAGRAPIVLAVNKADLSADAQYGEAEGARLAQAFHGESFLTSAKSGANVEEAFRRLAIRVAERVLRSE